MIHLPDDSSPRWRTVAAYITYLPSVLAERPIYENDFLQLSTRLSFMQDYILTRLPSIIQVHLRVSFGKRCEQTFS